MLISFSIVATDIEVATTIVAEELAKLDLDFDEIQSSSKNDSTENYFTFIVDIGKDGLVFDELLDYLEENLDDTIEFDFVESNDSESSFYSDYDFYAVEG